MSTATSAEGPTVGARVRLGHVALAATRPDRLASFYRDVIGLPVVRHGSGELAGAGVLFSGRPDEEDQELVLLANPQAAHVAFCVPSRAGLADFQRRAIAAGVPMPLAPQDFGIAWSVFVTDPGGHLCEISWATGCQAAARRPLDFVALSDDPANGPQRSEHHPTPGEDGSGVAGGGEGVRRDVP